MTIAHLCIEGTKGAGKTTTIAATRERLEAQGCVVAVHALFHEANAWAKQQGFDGGVPMMESAAEPNRAVVRWLIERERAARDAFARAHGESAQRAVLLSDRGWITLHAYLFEGAWAREPGAADEIDERWREALGAAPATVFIHTRPEVTAQRRAGALDAVSGLQSEQRLRADYERRMALSRAHADKLVGQWETGAGAFVDLSPLVVARVEALFREQ